MITWVDKNTFGYYQGLLPCVVYTDHSSSVNIATSTSLKSASSDNQNLRLIRASQFIQQFNIRVFHRPGKSNLIADALSRLPSSKPTPANYLRHSFEHLIEQKSTGDKCLMPLELN